MLSCNGLNFCPASASTISLSLRPDMPLKFICIDTSFAYYLTFPPHTVQVSILILKPRRKRCTRVIEARHSVGVDGSSATLACLRLQRLTLVTTARCSLFGARPPRANTPCERVRLTRSFGSRAASRAMKTTRPDPMIQKLTCDVPLRYGITLTTHSSSLIKDLNRCFAAQKGVDDVFQYTEQLLSWLADNNSFTFATNAEIAQNP